MHTLRLLTIASLVAVPALINAQDRRATDVLKAAREALGGEARLAGVKTVTATGRTIGQTPGGQTEETEFQLSIELPDKFMKREVMVAMGPTSIYRHSGFNGGALIDEIDAPPALASGGHGGGMWVRRIEVGGPGDPAAPPSPEAVAATNRRLLGEARQSFARLTLGMFAASFSGYPLTFTHAGQAESPDGRADVLDVSDGADFKARLFVDAASHLPLMLTWMDQEPLELNVEDNGDGPRVRIIRRGGEGGPPPAPGSTPEEQDLAARLKEAEANRKVVEYRAFYGDYRTIDGVKVPTRISRSVAGRPLSEIVLDRVRLNTRIDPKTFTPTKK